MKKFLAIFLIALLAFQAIHCQENEEENEIHEEVVQAEEQVNPEVEADLEEAVEVEVENEPEEEVQTEEEVNTEFEEENEQAVGTGVSTEDYLEDNLDGWNDLDVDEFLQDADNIRIINFGSQFVIADQQGRGQLPNASISVDEVYSIHHDTDEDGNDLYRFNLTIGASNSQDGSLVQYTVLNGDQTYVNYRITTYSIWSDYDYYEDQQDKVDRLKITWTYANDTYLSQRINKETGELKSETLLNPWTDVATGQFVGDDVLVKQWAADSAATAIPKALKEGTIEAGDWTVVSSDTWKYSDYVFGTEYYRFTIHLADATNQKDAYGYAYGASPLNEDFAPYTSGIYSLEDFVENGR